MNGWKIEMKITFEVISFIEQTFDVLCMWSVAESIIYTNVNWLNITMKNNIK
jgi:hypothetical protein